MNIINNLQKASRILSTYTSPFIIAIAILSFIFPSSFLWVSGYTQTVILGIIMLSMGLTLTTNDFKILSSRPGDILIGTIAQYTIMPCIAWSLCQLFHLDEALSIGIILVGCCPGGVSSNIMSYLCKGDVAFSIGMTTVSTILAPFVTPLLVLLLANKTVNINAVGMFLNILIVTIIPILIGFLLNKKYNKSNAFPTLQNLMPGVGVICLACIVGGVVCNVHGYLIENGWLLFLWTFGVVFCHNTLGYIVGYWAGKFAHFGVAQNRTISIEVGMQNAGLATNLSTNFFMATLPLAVVPCAISCIWHSISGTLLASFFLWRSKREK